MPRGIDSLLILAFLSHTSSFHLGVDSRHVRTSENSDENSRQTVGGSEEFALSGRENVTHGPDNKETAGLSRISENFINCTRIFDTLEALDNEMQIREATVPIAKLERLARAKRGTTNYRDDTADNEGRDAAVQTGEEESLPAEGNSQSGVPDDLGNPNGAVEAGVDEEATPDGGEGDIGKDPDAEVTEEEEEEKEIEAANENEDYKVDEEAGTDGDGGPEENSEGENEKDEDEKEQASEAGEEEAVDENGKEEAVDQGGEEEPANEDGEEEAADEEGEGDVDYEAESEYEYSEEAGISIDTLIEWGMGQTVQDIWNFIVDLEKLVSFTGDYILSLLLRGLKRDLRQTGIHEKFKAKLEVLAASPDVDRPQAMQKLMTEIRKQFGRTYEKKIVEFLKDLREGFKS